jgi:NADH dehydrogenase/NADH:ubiquinone oxidoreductase subunit G
MAQGPAGGDKPTQSGKERVQALKVAFITQRLNLTSEEAEKFWPIYNEYQDKREAVRQQLAENRKKINEQSETLTPEELMKLADQEMTLRQQDLDLQKEMHEKLKKVLPAKKLALLYVAEEEFKKELLTMLKNDNGGKDPKDGKAPNPK